MVSLRRYLCSCGAVVGKDYKGFVLPSAVVILIHKVFCVLLGFDDYLQIP